jgi:hypothetical protein
MRTWLAQVAATALHSDSREWAVAEASILGEILITVLDEAVKQRRAYRRWR